SNVYSCCFFLVMIITLQNSFMESDFGPDPLSTFSGEDQADLLRLHIRKVAQESQAANNALARSTEASRSAVNQIRESVRNTERLIEQYVRQEQLLSLLGTLANPNSERAQFHIECARMTLLAMDEPLRARSGQEELAELASSLSRIAQHRELLLSTADDHLGSANKIRDKQWAYSRGGPIVQIRDRAYMERDYINHAGDSERVKAHIRFTLEAVATLNDAMASPQTQNLDALISLIKTSFSHIDAIRRGRDHSGIPDHHKRNFIWNDQIDRFLELQERLKNIDALGALHERVKELELFLTDTPRGFADDRIDSSQRRNSAALRALEDEMLRQGV
ncbi:MAG: hypothetical protein K2W95_23050, partial [Candidatus Obscuribacterales bacterium]|nr:hypothetical protein [Candidatus Obscuribacterales bacterium]